MVFKAKTAVKGHVYPPYNLQNQRAVSSLKKYLTDKIKVKVLKLSVQLTSIHPAED